MSVKLDPQLLQALLSGGDGGAMADVLAQRGRLDPKTQLLIQMLSRSEQAIDEVDGASPGGDDLAPDAGGLDRRRHLAKRIRRTLTRMRSELEELRELNDALAAALGACPSCWGGVEDCAVCGGRGGPGSRPPDPKLYEHFVAPAMRRMQRPLLNDPDG